MILIGIGIKNAFFSDIFGTLQCRVCVSHIIMQRFLCLLCLKELASKKSVINHLKSIHDEADPDNYECFQSEDISDKNNAPSDSKDVEDISSVVDADLETNRPLDNAHYDALIQFGDVDVLLDQEIKNQQTGGVLNVHVELLVDDAAKNETANKAANKTRKIKPKKQENKVSYFQPLNNCFNNSRLMEPFQLHKRSKVTKDLPSTSSSITNSNLSGQIETLDTQAPLSVSVEKSNVSMNDDVVSQPADSPTITDDSSSDLSGVSRDHPQLPSNMNDGLTSDTFNMNSGMNRQDKDINILDFPITGLDLFSDSFSIADVTLNLFNEDSIDAGDDILGIESLENRKRAAATFKVPYKQSKVTACDFEDCSFCAIKTDCGMCVFCLNKLKM